MFTHLGSDQVLIDCFCEHSRLCLDRADSQDDQSIYWRTSHLLVMTCNGSSMTMLILSKTKLHVLKAYLAIKLKIALALERNISF